MTWTARSPLERLAIVIWAALLLGVGGRVLFGPPRSHTVVPIYLTAAERWVEGENLYEPTPPLDVYRNPPGVAAAFVPLTWVPERFAELVWRGISVAVLLIGIGVWARHALPRPLTAGERGAIFALVALIAIPSVNNGQANLVLIGALLLGSAAAASRCGVRAGFWFGLAAAVKVYPAAVAMLACAANPRRVLMPFVAAAALFGTLPFLLQSPSYVASEYRHFRESVTADDRTFADLGRAPQDAILALRVWAAAPPTEVYLAFKVAVAAAMAGLVLVAARRADPRRVQLLAFNLGCCWITVLGPATEIHTYVLLAPTAAVLLLTAFAQRRSLGGKFRLAAAAIGYGLIVLPILRDAFPNGKWFHTLALPPIGGLILLALSFASGLRLLARGGPSASVVALRHRISIGGRTSAMNEPVR
jgi:hypothetical protein